MTSRPPTRFKDRAKRMRSFQPAVRAEGRWTAEEQSRFMVAKEKYKGSDWDLIAKYIGTRNASQARFIQALPLPLLFLVFVWHFCAGAVGTSRPKPVGSGPGRGGLEGGGGSHLGRGGGQGGEEGGGGYQNATY